jgi:hypothetical protein
MKNRRYWLGSVIGGLSWLIARPSSAQDGHSFNSAQQGRGAASLKDQLTRGLRTATPEQEKFVDKVVMEVESGRLPRALVNLMYRWSLERNPRIPFPYFQYGITVMAKRQGVSL